MLRYLTPRLLGAHALGLVCVLVAAGLGVWQFSAWQAQRTAERTDLTQAAPMPLTEVMGPDDPFPGRDVGRPVTLSGTWLPDSTVYVSGREAEGVEGYWVVTAVAVGDSGAVGAPALPVVRGWIPALDRAPAPPTGRATLETWLQPGEGTGEMDEDPSDDVLPQMRIGDLIQRVDQDLYDAYGVSTEPLDGLAPASLEQLPPAGQFTALRNLLYALEWWVFAAFAAYIWVRFVREEVTGHQPARPGRVASKP